MSALPEYWSTVVLVLHDTTTRFGEWYYDSVGQPTPLAVAGEMHEKDMFQLSGCPQRLVLHLDTFSCSTITYCTCCINHCVGCLSQSISSRYLHHKGTEERQQTTNVTLQQ
jgi:hypothetical protein